MSRRTIRVELETESGTSYRLRLRPLDEQRVEVLEWKRRLPHWQTYRRDRREEGRTYLRTDLRLEPRKETRP